MNTNMKNNEVLLLVPPNYVQKIYNIEKITQNNKGECIIYFLNGKQKEFKDSFRIDRFENLGELLYYHNIPVV